jgi:prepilin-type N-terminal cleavage/methylation domain-containing protein
MRNDAPRNNIQGFTLIEIIIYLLIFGVVGTVAANVLNAAIQAKVIVAENTQVQLDSQRVMERLVDLVHSSVGIQTTSTTNLVVLQMADPSKNPTIIRASDATLGITIQEGASAAVSIQPSTLTVVSYSMGYWSNPSPSTSTAFFNITFGYKSNGQLVNGTQYTVSTNAMPL